MRERILSEIRRLARANGGRPPGRGVFEQETGIPQSAWYGVHWVRWGEAVHEAGFEPNKLTQKLDQNVLLRGLAEAFRHFGRVPTMMELRMYHRSNKDLPNEKVITAHFGSKQGMLSRLARWTEEHAGYEDVSAMLAPEMVTSREKLETAVKEGFVYLIRSGSHFKIGRSDEIERRMKEIRVALPDAATLIHSIRTDDPAGIEAYWHRRFADRRANGEWFKLTPSDVAAFKRRKYQ